MITFDKIVHKLWKLQGDFVDLDDIARIADPDFRKRDVSDRAAIYKTVYRLKANDIIVQIRQGLYYVSMGEAIDLPRLIEERYWSIVRKILLRETHGEYVITGTKALEIALRDHSAPRRLIVSTHDSSGEIRLSDRYTVSLRTIRTGDKGNKKSLYPLLHRLSSRVDVSGALLIVAHAEPAILDALLVRDDAEWVDRYLIRKFLERSAHTLSRETLGLLVASGRYITAVNRLKDIAKEHRYTKLYEDCLDIVKREGGGCFVKR